ncbi:MAG: nodulation protein NodH, partial [Pseudomonadota bacterium]
MTQRYFAIIGTMRTGSNLLEKTIERFGDTACYGEAFNPGFISGPRKQDVLGWSVRERDADPTGFLESIITETPYLVPGFRIFDEHDRAVLEQVLADPRCRRIVLRRDPVESYVSLEIARLTGQWMLREPRNRMTARIRFDPEAFGRYRRRVEAHYADVEALMRRAGTNALQLDYADLDSRAILGRVAAHIGSRGVVPEAPPIQRQNSPDMMEKVENYEEMCAYLGGDFAA